jgi:ATP/ADP translocase
MKFIAGMLVFIIWVIVVLWIWDTSKVIHERFYPDKITESSPISSDL